MAPEIQDHHSLAHSVLNMGSALILAKLLYLGTSERDAQGCSVMFLLTQSLTITQILVDDVNIMHII